MLVLSHIIDLGVFRKCPLFQSNVEQDSQVYKRRGFIQKPPSLHNLNII